MNHVHKRRLMAPPRGHQAPWFSFVVHLRSRGDLDRWATTSTVRGDAGEGWRERVMSGPPLVASTFSFRSTPMTGNLIVIPRLPEDIIFGDGPKLVARAVEIAAARGARVVGLAGLTAPATRGGESLLPALPHGVTLTNGNSYTAAVSCANVREACRFLGCDRPTVAVVGSTGSVGMAASRLLAEDEEVDLVLIGRTTERARKAGPDSGARVTYSGRLEDVADADVVLTLTHDRAARLRPELFDGSRERVIIDVAQPTNVEVDQRGAFAARRVRVVRGGWVLMPGGISSQDHTKVMTDGDPDAAPGSAPACLAETCLFAADGIHEHAVGPGSADLGRLLEEIAARRGILVAPLSLEAAGSPGPVVDAVGR
jgi:fatty aldehyde-generating acyl-ACP reductase